MKRSRLSRRLLLRGAGGIALGLPLLDAMMPRSARAATTPPALRFVGMYFPDGTYQGTQITGRKMGLWHPAATGALSGQTLPPVLEGLADNLADFTVVSGVNNRAANYGNGKGAGGHNRAISGFLTASEQRSDTSVNIGPSMDQVYADHVATSREFARHSLVLGTMAATTAPDSGVVTYMNHVSYRNGVNVPLERNPRMLFDGLFGSVSTPQGQPRDPALNASILDFIKDDTTQLVSKLGTADQNRVDEYLTGVRELERRVLQLEREVAATCQLHMAPNATLNGTYQNDLPLAYTLQVEAMVDIIVTAFRCDFTRAASLLLAAESHNIAYSKVVTQSYEGVSMADGRHIGSAHHEDNLDKIRRLISIHQYDLRFFKRLLDKLKAIPEGEKTLLDNTVILFGCGLADGNNHNFENVPVLVGGRGGGVIAGRHVSGGNTPLANLQLDILQRLGVPATSFGEGQGKSTGLVRLG